MTRRVGRGAPIAGALALALGFVVLAGWVFDLPRLRQPIVDQVAVKANTGVCFVLLGAGLCLASLWGSSRGPRRLALVLVAPAMALGLVTLAEYALGRHLGVDQLIVDEPAGTLYTMWPGRLALLTAILTIISGLAIVLLVTAGRRARDVARALALLVAAVAFSAVLAYMYGRNEVYGLGSGTPIGFPTASGFVALGLGIACLRPGEGWLAIVSGAGPGSVASRPILLLAMAVLPLLGWLTSAGERAGRFDSPYGIALFVIVALVLLVALALLSGAQINRGDARRRAAERALLDNEQLITSIVDNSPAVIYLEDLDHRMLLVNRTFAELAALRPDEVVGKRAQELHGGVFSEPVPATKLIEASWAADRHMIDTGGPYSTDVTIEIDGDLRTMQTVRFPVRDADGVVRAFGGVATDITVTKRLTEASERLNDQLREERDRGQAANKELESFAYTVSHDLRSPLRAIAGFSQILREEYSAELAAEPRRYLDLIVGGTEQMARLIDELLSFSRLGRHELSRRAVDMTELARAVVDQTRADWNGREVRIAIHDLPPADGDPDLLRLVLSNLISNAVKYTRPRDIAEIEVGASNGGGLAPVYYVKDNGVGFDMRYADKLFGVFQRLHRAEDYEGTGVGLATVQRIVHRHGGHVWASAKLDHGATFYFDLTGDQKIA